MSEKKVDIALKQIDNALKTGLKTLNELSDGNFKGPLEEQSLEYAGYIIGVLQRVKNDFVIKAQYDGLSDAEIEAKKAQERDDEKKAVLEAAAKKLDDLAAKKYIQPDPDDASETVPVDEMAEPNQPTV